MQMDKLRPIDSIMVYDTFKHRLPNGSYIEWLESLGAPVRELGFYISLQVSTYTVSLFEEEWEFSLRGDDCVIARYTWNTRTQKLVCESAFVDDDECVDLTVEMFNERLKEFCETYHLTPRYMVLDAFKIPVKPLNI